MHHPLVVKGAILHFQQIGIYQILRLFCMYHPTNHHGCIPCTEWMTTKISDGPMCMYIILLAVKIVICRLIYDRWCYMSHDTLWLEAKCDHCRSYLELKSIAYTITSFSLTKMITNNTVFGNKRYH